MADTPSNKTSDASKEQSAKNEANKNEASKGESNRANASAQNPSEITSRRFEFLFAPRVNANQQPTSTDKIKTALEQMTGVTVLRRIKPTNLDAFASEENSTNGDVIVAEMSYERGVELASTTGGTIIIEHNHPLQHLGELYPFFASANATFPQVSSANLRLQIKVKGDDGAALPKAQIILYGPGFPVQSETDENGLAVLAFKGAPESIQAIYVKPHANYWEKWVPSPALDPETVNTITLASLSAFEPAGFPGNPFLGWGQRLLGLTPDVTSKFSGRGVKIAIIDSGVDNNHPALQHIKHGLDFTNRDAAGEPDPHSWNIDVVSHGTHGAGIIAGNGHNGIRGFAPEAEVHALKLFPGGKFDDLISALKYAIDNRIDVVNLSLGNDQSSEIVFQWLERARQAGIAVVVAAGNSAGPVQFPALLPNVLSVAAVGQDGDYPADTFHRQSAPAPALGVIGVNGIFAARFSSFGPQVKVSAPGVAIISSVPGGGYAAWDGTSMAAPHVTGLLALVAAHSSFAALPRNANRVDTLFQAVIGGAVPTGLDLAHGGAGIPSLARALAFAPPPAQANVDVNDIVKTVLANFQYLPQASARPWSARPFGDLNVRH
jgi:subtilisin